MGLVVEGDGWRIPDDLWAEMEPLLPPRPSHPLGCHRPRVPDRDAMNAILFVLPTGCQWNALNVTAPASAVPLLRIVASSSGPRRVRFSSFDGAGCSRTTPSPALSGSGWRPMRR
jgi:transposase